MAQFQQQQKSFMENQATIDWGSDIDEDEENEEPVEDRKHSWKYPTGTCILCQEDADDRKLYGTFALLNNSRVLRQTDFQDADLVREASQTPCSLDRSAEDIRPFGIAHENRKMVEKLNSAGESFLAERQTIGKGFPSNLSRSGPVASGCGHMMHYRCFDLYYEATNRRHTHQIARHHPEDTRKNEFVCPLCKALGNAFLPIVWKGLEQSYPGKLQTNIPFDYFMETQMGASSLLGHSKAKEIDDFNAPDLTTPSFPGSLMETIVRPQPSVPAEGLWAGLREDSDSRSSTVSTPATSTPQSSAFSSTNTPEPALASAVAPPQGMVSEIVLAYRRLCLTMRVNGLDTRYPVPKAELGDGIVGSDTLVQMVSYSIAATEIQQRGLDAQPGSTLLDKIPEQLLTQLRILAETASSYALTATLPHVGDSRVVKELQEDSARQHCQLFMSRYMGRETAYAAQPLEAYPPLLSSDPFVFLVECAYGLMPTQKVDVSHLLRVCYLAEIVKVVYHMGRNMPTEKWLGTFLNRQTQDPAMHNFADFALAIAQYDAEARASKQDIDDKEKAHLGFQQPGVDTLESWYMFVKKYALVFLRKSVIFMYVKCGVDFQSHISSEPEAEELERLTEALKLPTFDEMCASLTHLAATCGWPGSTGEMIDGWVKHQVLRPTKVPADSQDVLPPSAMVSHPGIFELVGLPKNYDTLIEEATRRRCPTTGKDLTDPTICLFCGELFCSQGTCCSKLDRAHGRREPTRIGGCQQHMRK
jgi:E3 ubiquitin-protein ligase UBR1